MELWNYDGIWTFYDGIWTDLSINLMEILPIDPVGVKVSLVLGHLPGLGRVSKPISQKFHFKNGKIYRFTVKITVNYGQMGIFDDLAIARKKALQTPLFFAMLRETPTPIAIVTIGHKMQLWIFVQWVESLRAFR